MTSNHNKTILLVEDEVLIALVKQKELEKYGYNVLTINTGEKAVTISKENVDIDLILMDIDLGRGIDGTEAAEFILKERDIPVVFLSSHTEPEVVEKTEKITSYGYIVKSSGITVLDASIKMAFKLFEAKTKEKAKEDERQLEYERVLSILNAIPDGVYIVSKQYDIEYINPTIKEQFGPIKGRKCYEYFHDLTEVCPWCKHSEIYEGKSVQWNWYSFKNNRYYELFDAPIVNVDGSISKFEIFHDVTKRKKAEDALRENKELLNSIFTSMQDLIFIIDKNKCFTNYYNAPDSLLYTPSDQFIGKSIYETLPPNVSEPFGKLIDKLFKTGKLQKFDYSLTMNDEINWYSANLNSILNNDGEIISVVAVVRDITERKQVEENLRIERDNLKNIFEAMDDGVYIISKQYDLQFVNRTLINDFGNYTGRKCYEYFHDRKEACPWCKNPEVFEGKTARSESYSQKTGKSYDVIDLPFKNSDESISKLRVFHDVTRYKQLNELISVQKQRLSNILQGTNVGSWEWNVQTGETSFNERWAEIIGYTLEEIAPVSIDTWISFTHPNDLKKSEELLKKHFTGELDNYECEARMRHKDGHWVWVLDRGKVATWSEDGKPILMFGTHQDITRRMQAQEVLHQYEHIVSSSTDMLACMDKEYNYIIVNEAYSEAFKLTPKQFIGKNTIDIFGEEYFNIYIKPIADRCLCGEEINIQNWFNYPTYGPRYTSRTYYPYYSNDNNIMGYVVNVRNITEQKKAQDEIKNQLLEKEIILKEVHHRIKNNFASIGSLLSLQSESLTNPEAISALKEAIGRVYSMQILYEKLLLTDNFNVTSLKQYLDNLIDDIVNLFSEGISVTIEKQIADIQLDSKRLIPIGIIVNELLTNIMKYAFKERDTGIIEVTVSENKGEISLTIQDNGTGLPAGFDIIESKSLGLMLVKMLSEQLDGSFSIENNNGTKSTLEFSI